MSQILVDHLQGILADMAEAQELLDQVLTYNTVDLFLSNTFTTMLKRHKMERAEEVLGRIRDDIERLPAGFLPLPPAYDTKKGQYLDYFINYSVADDTKAVKAGLTELVGLVRKRLDEVEAYLAEE